MHLTPEIMVGVYDLLRLTMPFKKWNLPPSDEIEFRVTNNVSFYGYFLKRRDGHKIIGMSRRKHQRLESVILTMAHEMIHVFEQTNHPCRDDVQHSKRFQQLKRQVCKAHEFEDGAFGGNP